MKQHMTTLRLAMMAATLGSLSFLAAGSHAATPNAAALLGEAPTGAPASASASTPAKRAVAGGAPSVAKPAIVAEVARPELHVVPAVVASAPSAADKVTSLMAAHQSSDIPKAVNKPAPTREESIVNPMTGEALSIEELRGSLATATLLAQIAEQNFKTAQSQSQIAQLRFVAIAPKADAPKPVSLATALPAAHAEPKRPPRARAMVAPPLAMPLAPVLVQSPVTGIMTQNGARYAVLQLSGKGEMAKIGDIVQGRHVDAIDASGVTLDGRFYPVVTPVTEIASVDPQTMGGKGQNGPAERAPVTGGVMPMNMTSPNPFSQSGIAGLPPLPATMTVGGGQR